MFKSFGVDEQGKAYFKPVWAVENFSTAQKIQKVIERAGRPPNTPPATPDIFHLRIGAANFFVPPISISINTGFKTSSLTGGAIRQKASPKFNSGHRETTINLRLYFPNYEEVWGINVDDGSNISVDSKFKVNFSDPKDEHKVDKFLSSLRGLVAAFKYSPILPIKNHYLNSVHGITGVALNSMNISTIPNYPFALVVDLELLNFNHKAFLPMLNDFNQAVHWGKYRQYMGKVAGSMYNYINEDFILQSDIDKEAAKKQDNPSSQNSTNNTPAIGSDANAGTDQPGLDEPYNFETDVLTTNPYSEWEDGKNIALYVPAQVQSKIFSPDVSTFRTPEEVAQTDLGRGFWENLLNIVGIDINEFQGYNRSLDSVIETARNTNIPLSLRKRVKKIVDVALVGVNQKDISDKVYQYLVLEYISINNISDQDAINYLKNPKPAQELEVPSSVGGEEDIEVLKKAKQNIYNAAKSPSGYFNLEIDLETDKLARKNKLKFDDETKKSNEEWLRYRSEIEKKYTIAFDVSLYERFYTNADIKSLLEAARDKQGSFSFREWDVPMMMVDLDNSSVVVNSVNVALGNNLAKMQLQMQDEATYQHIGAKDSYVNISMTVFGEKELIKLKKTFDFLSGLARLEKAAGVIGFMGIKNIITALSGIKYVMPLSYSVDTIPGFPHAYSVQLSLVDFDVYQQKREKLSTAQQRKFIDEFKNKRNPFLRLKQNWSAFNAYPDMPLMIKDENGDVLGSLDPDFYFRSFETFDQDIINSLIDPENFNIDIYNSVEKIELDKEGKNLVDQVKQIVLENGGSIVEAKDFLIKEMNLKPADAMEIFRYAIFDKENDTPVESDNLSTTGNLSNKYPEIWKDFIDDFVDEFGEFHTFEDLKFETKYGNLKIGELLSGSKEQIESFNKLVVSSQYSLEKGELPSIDPDESDFMGLVQYFPSAESSQLNKIPAILQTPDGGFVFGYSNEEDGRFYIAADSLNVSRDPQGNFVVNGVNTTKVVDTSAPDRDPQNVHTGVQGAQPINKYMKPYSSNDTDKIQSVSQKGTSSAVAKHWEKMMMDAQYRDISGRMIRAFPTYMLWLIDEGGYFAGVKLFENFYGLQSVIDFSIVQSEDILGDTLILRLSNVYSKLTKPELTITEIVGSNISENPENNLAYGTAALIDTLLNTSRNFSNHFDSRYTTEIENVRLKPGVRVHLRAGYGANPNSLQTLFNGVITNVEGGEILTVTAQSDAIELSPIINSTNKKGDSGKIDGGINTGLWLSEPRDLMIRLLSMGASRTREAFAHATRGTVFSENKFGIRHFGTILYEPLTDKEQKQYQDYRSSVANTYYAIGNNPVGGTFNALANTMTGGFGAGSSSLSAGGYERKPIFGAITAMWSNLSTQRDLEIFKRNIYPGNGIGIAQFLGGDIDDGWSVLASVDESKIQSTYLDRLSDFSNAKLIQLANQSGEADASQALDNITSGNKLIDSSNAVGTSQILGGVLAGTAAIGIGALTGGAGVAVGAGIVGIASGGLLSSLGGRGSTSIFKTLGLVSDLDDDIYDEVSFRAQTYMRSVWDMFQLCARLLPNYIVAVRPFEDRSTVFYGKPHWLYTSGVVPISTGYINEQQAQIDGVTIPPYSGPDQELTDILNKINKETSPLADANAFSSLTESSLSSSLAKLSEDSISFKNIFSPGGSLKGAVIDFGDTNRNKYYEKGELKSRLPRNKGKVQVGFHLPFGNNNLPLGDSRNIQAPIQSDHIQSPYLPPRYRYPFFTNRTTGTLPSLDFDKIFKSSNIVDNLQDRSSTLFNIMIKESEILTQKGQKSKLVSQNQANEYSLNFNFDFTRFFVDDDPALQGHAAFDPSGIRIENELAYEASNIVQMPLPIIDLQPSMADVTRGAEGNYEFNEKFKDIFADLNFAYTRQTEFSALALNFTEWGMPETAEDEQFYIAMRWPYDPVDFRQKMYGQDLPEEYKKEVLKKFLSDYSITSTEENPLVGTPQDYKKRKVLVYNTATKQAVVCKPAYFLWGETQFNDDLAGAGSDSGRVDAIVSPDAALYLGLLIDENGAIRTPFSENLDKMEEKAVAGALNFSSAIYPDCYFTFVEDSVPVGVVTSAYNPAQEFYSSIQEAYDNQFSTEGSMKIGFGKYIINEQYSGDNAIDPTKGSSIPYVYTADARGSMGVFDPRVQSMFTGLKTSKYTFDSSLKMLDSQQIISLLNRGGNYINYFDLLRSVDTLNQLEEKKLVQERNKGENTFFQSVYDPIDQVSIQARGFYDEDFDREIKVITGNGRTLKEAQNIWDQFRWGYHTYNSVKNIFGEIYGMDPDDDNPEGNNPIINALTSNGKDSILEEFNKNKNNYSEFNALLGSDWVSSISSETKKALDISINEYINNGFDGFDADKKITTDTEKGIIDIFNRAIENRVSFIADLIKNNVALFSRAIFTEEENVSSQDENSETQKAKGQQAENQGTSEVQSANSSKSIEDLANEYIQQIKTPKQLFLLLVGLFRQKMWEDAYSRAWLVLRPDRKRFVQGGDKETDVWSFRPVDKIWQAFIDYNNTYAKDSNKFKSLLKSNAKEGNSATNWASGAFEDTKSFWDKNIGPMFTVFSSAIGNLMNMFRLSMNMMGYGLSEVGNFTKQANILNKAYNDSIYYSLGRPGSLLRAVDNPFTREYAEPVVEVREPFQRVHYLSSFTHILTNKIEENLSGVATQITAVSDGKYPVTVALDKAAPAERQVEKTVETGIYFDNILGSGFFGVLHPIMHPLQTIRGISKSASGEPDELTARRIGLSHLKESIKDIYGGELTIIGNADIRPHDLVYLADVYERMYGIFEVEQVVHHFTPDMGFVTSIKPNAFVTVNDPARWFMSSWIASKFSMQNIRNDTRTLMSTNASSNFIDSTGQISVDSLSESLRPQILGGIMYTHGHSALVKDVMANTLADGMPTVADQMKQLIKNSTGRQDGSLSVPLGIAIGGPLLTAAASAVGAAIAGPAGFAAGLSIGAIGTDLAWSGWKWTRDNILDQHGCYVQYLNKNGQPMDAGLSFNQGMVVGRYHSKKLLPTLLGVRNTVRTPEGYAYIRSDDLLRSIGWREKEIADLVRHISLENAIVNSQLLQYSGIGPEKTGLNQFFRVIATVESVFDGDTFVVKDVISEKVFTVRFEGVDTSELSTTNVSVAVTQDVEGGDVSLINPNTSAGQALLYTLNSVVGKPIVLRISPSTQAPILTEDDLEAGAELNSPNNYSAAKTKEGWTNTRYMATVFHRADNTFLSQAIQTVRFVFIDNLLGNSVDEETVKESIKSKINYSSIVYKKYEQLYGIVKNIPKLINYFNILGESDPLANLDKESIKVFSALVSLLVLDKVYLKASEWPLAGWDEYYQDGTPFTLNWELVTKGLAKVYTKGLLFVESPAQVPIEDQIPMPGRSM
jgi:hypothetical protein